VPISAFVFGGRRSDTVPLVTEAPSWEDGVYMAATLGSETTAAIVGQVGVVRRDPFAMLAFCGYNMSDYFAHWLAIGEKIAPHNNQPKFYTVNWFRKDANGKFMWPGFGENMRVLKWIVERAEGNALSQRSGQRGGQQTPLGIVPTYNDLDWSGLAFDQSKYQELSTINLAQWGAELKLHDELLTKLAVRLPAKMKSRYELLIAKLGG
jgi:phosphoenolpyruvate carboxykinase (GTP)